jgi:hypothetical protein
MLLMGMRGLQSTWFLFNFIFKEILTEWCCVHRLNGILLNLLLLLLQLSLHLFEPLKLGPSGRPDLDDLRLSLPESAPELLLNIHALPHYRR